MADEAPPDKLVGALTSGLRVLRYLARTGQAGGVTRIARDLDLNASTCFNLLKTLVHEGLVVFDEPTKTYSVGLGLVELAKGTLEQTSYVRMLRPHLVAIAERHPVTATLWHRTSRERVVLVDRAENDSAIRVHMSIGQRLPMYIAALGRCMAAHSGLSREELRQRFEALRWEDGPSFETYVAEVEDARLRGYAFDHGNYVKGVTTVSTAVLDAAGHGVMAISAVAFAAQMDEARIATVGEELRQRAAQVSQAMGGSATR